jgi:hypothetical protein
MRGRLVKVLGKYPGLSARRATSFATQHRARAAYRWSVDTSVYVRQGAATPRHRTGPVYVALRPAAASRLRQRLRTLSPETLSSPPGFVVCIVMPNLRVKRSITSGQQMSMAASQNKIGTIRSHSASPRISSPTSPRREGSTQATQNNKPIRNQRPSPRSHRCHKRTSTLFSCWEGDITQAL